MTSYRAAVYLQIPAEYCRSFDGLRWAHYGEAIEFLSGPAAGCTFAFAREIALFLEGSQSVGGALLDFGFVLHLLYLIGLGERATRDEHPRRLERIAGPFRALGCPLRNAGALCAWLCRGVPRATERPSLSEVHELLLHGSWIPQMVLTHPFLGSRDQAEEPLLEPAEFETRVRRALEGISDEAIRHWLRHGQGALETDRELLVSLRPRGLTSACTELEERPRLVGVARLVSRLEGALCLPPRRRASAELPCGGYSDVTTRGSPEQILPIQFALESEEFLRRFAGQELLYFHREEPRQPATEELVLLLDQGVRTWGDVRLVLAGATLALARQAQRRQITIKLTATSQGGEVVDPTEIDAGALLRFLEASDLSPHPAAALAALLQSAAAAHRDVVLLTHARSVSEPGVAAAALLHDPCTGSRLFAVSVDGQRRVELAELRGGLPVVLSRCRIDGPKDACFTPAFPHVTRRTAWKGDVEPIGFPFHCGVLERVENRFGPRAQPLDFDDSGARILCLGRHGLLSTCRIDGTDLEILPRPLVDGRTLLPMKEVIGVADGFVLVGHRDGKQVFAHYDFASRTCVIHKTEAWAALTSWFYFRDLHALAGRPAHGAGGTLAIDLVETGPGATATPRAVRAAKRVNEGVTSHPPTNAQLSASVSDPSLETGARALELDSTTGTLHYCLGAGELRSVTPLSDGRPALLGGWIVRDRQGGDVLAALVDGCALPGLYFISPSRASVLGTFPFCEASSERIFALSRDGRRFARLPGKHQLEVRDVPGGGPPVLVMSREDVWVHFAALGKSCLLVREFELTGPRHVRSSCLFRWDQARLEVVFDHADALLDQLGFLAVSRSMPPGHSARTHESGPVRFVQVIEHNALEILLDRYNHIAVLRESGELLCMFYVNRGEVAAWMADGTCWGSRRLIGGEPTPGAAVRIAAALRSAERGERVSL